MTSAVVVITVKGRNTVRKWIETVHECMAVLRPLDRMD